MATAQRPVRRIRPNVGKEGETLFIPSKSFVAVAIPGRVNSTATALRQLGGRHAVESYLASLPTIPLLPASSAPSFFTSTAAAPATPDPSTASPPVLPFTGGLSASAHASAPISGAADRCSSLTSSSASCAAADLRFTVASPTASSLLSGVGATAGVEGPPPSAAAVALAPVPDPSSSTSSPPSSGGGPASPAEEKLFLRFAQDPVYFKYVASTPAPAAGLLLRIRRRRRSGSSIEILGRVVKRHSFEGLADFYYAPPGPARAALDFRSLLLDKDKENENQRVDEQQGTFHRYSPCGCPSLYGLADSESCFFHSRDAADFSSSSPASVGFVASSSSAACSFPGLSTFSSSSRHQVLPFIPPPVFCRFTQPAKQNLFDVLFGDEPAAAGPAAVGPVAAARSAAAGPAAAVNDENTAAAVPASATTGAVPPAPVTKKYDTSAASYHTETAVARAAVAAAAPGAAPPSLHIAASFRPTRHFPLAPTLSPNATSADDLTAAASRTSVMTAISEGSAASERLQQQRLRALGEDEKASTFDYDHSQPSAAAPAGSFASAVPTTSPAAAPSEYSRTAVTPAVADASSAPLHAGAAVAGAAVAGAASAGAAAAGAAAGAAAAAGAGAAAAAAAAAAAVSLIIRSPEGAAADASSPPVTEALPIVVASDRPTNVAAAAGVRVPSILQLQRRQQGQKQLQQQQQQVPEKTYSLRQTAAAEEGSDAGSATEGESEMVNWKKKQQQQQGRGQVGRGDEVTAAETEMLWLSSKKSGEEFNAVCRYGDPSVPLVPPAAARAVADEGLLSLLLQLLQQQPVWLRSSLDLLLPPEFSAWRRKPAYAKTCFLFADGPWRGCLCKFGYDPRSSAASRFYQTIDFRDSFFRTTNWRRIKEKEDTSIASGGAAAARRVTSSSSPSFVKTQQERKNEKGASAAFGRGEEEESSMLQQQSSSSPALLEQHFLLPPSRPSVLYQLKEIRDDAVQKLLQDAPILPLPCKETGWFPASTMKTLRELLAIKSERMRKSRST